MEMTRLMLDTSAYSAFMRGHTKIHSAIQEAEELYFCPIILGELLVGFMKGGRKKENESELKEFLSSPRVIFVDFDLATSERYAVILNSLWKAGTPIPTNDLWIAASAMQHGLRLLTTDAHFQNVNQIIVDHFQTSS